MGSDRSKENAMKFLPVIARLVAGLPLLGLGAMHFVNPEHFRKILEVSGLPAVEVSLFAAPVAEVLAGILLLTGFQARIGGVLAIATMAPAILATIKINEQIAAGTLPADFKIPPLPVPVAVLLCGALVAAVGAGAFSVDGRKKVTA